MADLRGVLELDRLCSSIEVRRQRGGEHFKAKRYGQALVEYQAGLAEAQEMFNLMHTIPESPLSATIREKAAGDVNGALEVLSLNISLVMLRLERWQDAYTFADNAITVQQMAPSAKANANKSKAYFRRGTARAELGQVELAIEDMQRAADLEGGGDAAYIRQQIEALKAKRRQFDSVSMLAPLTCLSLGEWIELDGKTGGLAGWRWQSGPLSVKVRPSDVHPEAWRLCPDLQLSIAPLPRRDGSRPDRGDPDALSFEARVWVYPDAVAVEFATERPERSEQVPGLPGVTLTTVALAGEDAASGAPEALTHRQTIAMPLDRCTPKYSSPLTAEKVREHGGYVGPEGEFRLQFTVDFPQPCLAVLRSALA